MSAGGALVLLAPALGAVLAVMLLARAHLSLVVAASMLLLGVGLVEPAPFDVMMAIALVVGVTSGRLRPDRLSPALLLLMGLFLALNIYALSAAEVQSRALRFLAITFFLVMVAAFTAMYVTSIDSARKLVGTYLVGAVVLAGLSTVAMYVHFPGSSSLLRPDGTRVKGLLKDPNVFGPYLIPVMMILFEDLIRPRLFHVSKVLKVGALSVLATGVLLSYSRAAWINAAVAAAVLLIAFGLRRDGGRSAGLAVLTLVVVCAAGGLLVLLTGSQGFLEQRAHLQRYDSQRFAAQDLGFAFAQEQPLSGIGPGQFEVEAPRASHSVYVRVLAEDGVPAFAVFTALLALTLGLAAHHALHGLDTYGVGSAALLASWCGLLVNGAVVDTLHWRHLWVVAGLVYAGVHASRERVEDRGQAGAHSHEPTSHESHASAVT